MVLEEDSMRLVRMSVAGFRGFATETEFDLDADTIVLSGFNGMGKTSFFDAILWGLTGSIERLGSDASVRNAFSEFGDARVEITLQTDSGTELGVVRRLSGVDSSDETLTVAIDSHIERGSTAQTLLLSQFFGGRDGLDESFSSLSSWLTKSVYLEQDRVREFVEASNEQRRFEIVGELVGAASLSKLNRELESARRAWSAQTNRMRVEVASWHEELNSLEDRLNMIDSSIEANDVVRVCSSWLRKMLRVVRRSEIKLPAEGAGLSAWAHAVDLAVGLIATEQQSLVALSRDVLNLRNVLEQEFVTSVDLRDMRRVVEELEWDVAKTSNVVNKFEIRAAAARRQRLTEVEESRSLASMAQLALRHMGDSCPVCGQAHDVEATERRLDALMKVGEVSADIPEEEEFRQAADRLNSLQRRLASEGQELQKIESMFRRLEEHKARIESSAEMVGLAIELQSDELLDSDALSDWLDSLESEVVVLSSELRALREDGMRVSASLAHATEAGEASGLRRQVAELMEKITEHESDCHLRDKAYQDARILHSAIRELEESFVDDELARIEDWLQAVYETVDPHPDFRVVRLLTKRYRGRGRLWTKLEAAANGKSIVIDEPKTVLSSSQLNVLAVSIFMAMNLSMKDLPLDVMALDDPLQSLDNMNLLGLADLLRHLRGRRQLIISTHDVRLAGLLERKLRPLHAHERTIALRLDAWDRSGVVLTTHDVHRDDKRLRLVVA